MTCIKLFCSDVFFSDRKNTRESQKMFTWNLAVLKVCAWVGLSHSIEHCPSQIQQSNDCLPTPKCHNNLLVMDQVKKWLSP
jgi:hypothetical protein